MPHKLHAARYADMTVGGSSPNENWDNIADLGIRWALPGGVQRIELTIRATSKFDAYRRYDNHLGNTIAIYDQAMHSYIHGQVFEIIPDGRHVTYVCAGPWKRTYDDWYDSTDWQASLHAGMSTDTAIKNVLLQAVFIQSTDQTNIAASGVAIGGWSPDKIGTYAGDAIKVLALAGDSADNPMDFYFVDGVFAGTKMIAPLPYFKSRSLTATPDWIFSVEDLAPNGLTLARHIWDLKTYVKIGYGRLAGVHDGGNGSNTLIDGSEDFITDGVKPGDRVINITDDAIFEVAAVTNLTTLTFTDNASASWDNNDAFSIRLKDPKWTSATFVSTDYWAVLYKEVRMEMGQTLAEQYRDQLKALYHDAQLQQAFVISAPTIKDSGNVFHPLWHVFYGPTFYFRADNLFIDEAVFTDSDDRVNSFMAVAMDYRYSTNTLRIVPSTGDSRLDSILNQAKLINGQIISTETAWRNKKREGEGS